MKVLYELVAVMEELYFSAIIMQQLLLCGVTGLIIFKLGRRNKVLIPESEDLPVI